LKSSASVHWKIDTTFADYDFPVLFTLKPNSLPSVIEFLHYSLWYLNFH